MIAMTEQDIVNKARELYMGFLPTLLVAYPKLSELDLEDIKNVKHIASISRPVIKSEEPLRDYIIRQLHEEKNYTFNSENNFIIGVPIGIVGESVSVVFEI